MDRLGKEFFPRAAFPFDHHVTVAGRGLFGQKDRLLQRGTDGDDILKVESGLVSAHPGHHLMYLGHGFQNENALYHRVVFRLKGHSGNDEGVILALRDKTHFRIGKGAFFQKHPIQNIAAFAV
ncbi:hypothetical protein DSECCO2_658270 [anaerobic digester metagenome]